MLFRVTITVLVAIIVGFAVLTSGSAHQSNRLSETIKEYREQTTPPVVNAVETKKTEAISRLDPPPPLNYQISSSSPELQNEEQIWTSPIDSTVVIAVWRDFRLGYRQVGIGHEIIPSFWIDSLIHPSMQVFSWQSDPTLTVDRNGNYYIGVLDYEPGNHDDSSHISVLKSTDNGASWTGPVTVSDTIGFYFEDKEFITTDMTTGPHSGNLYIAWARFPNPTRIMFARSTDGAASFDDTLVVGPKLNDQNCAWGVLDAGQFACPLVGSDGAVHVFWISYDIDSTTCNAYYALVSVKSTDGGASFGPRQVIRHTFGNWGVVDGGVDVYNQPTPAADISGGPFDGNLYVAYANVDTTNTTFYDYNIEFIRSTNGGLIWSQPLYINDDFTGPEAPFDQFHPWMICNSEGTIVVIFYDQRTDPATHTLFDAFVAYSFDGGETFTTNHRISAQSVNPTWLKSADKDGNIPDPDGPVYASLVNRGPRAGAIAEYIGITAFNDHVHATWTGTVYGNQDVFGADWTIPVLAPRLISPADGGSALTTDAVFDWGTAWKLNDVQYHLEISEVFDFASTVLTADMDTSIYLVPAAALTAGNDYYWRVRAGKVSTAETSEYSEIRTFTAILDTCIDSDGDGYGDPWEPGNTCPDDNCPYVYNPSQADSDGDGIGDACDLSNQVYDTVSTGCTQLTVGHHGNCAHDGDYGATLDYAEFGDCDPNADLYIYDGTPLLCYISGSDTIVEWTAYGSDTYADVTELKPTVPTIDTPEYQKYKTGTFVTNDSTLALEKTWWAPKHPDTCRFVIGQLRLFSYDGLPHSGLHIGEYVDWDIPSDDVAQNTGGYSPPDNLIYLKGSETNGSGCQPNDYRYGGQAFLGYYVNDSCLVDTAALAYGGYLADNYVYLFPSSGLVPSEVYQLMTQAGYSVNPPVPGATDYHVMTTFFSDYSLGAEDTLVIYSILSSVQYGTVDSLMVNLGKAQAWLINHLVPPCTGGCCNGDGLRGNVDQLTGPAGEIDVADLSYLVEYLFQGGPVPPCEDEGNVDGVVGPGGAFDVADLSYLVDYLFKGGPPPPDCP